MPNYYAHLKFGNKVLEGLPSPLAASIQSEREAFDLGCLGPDPLFFYLPLRPSATRREGVQMHRSSALPAAERLRCAIEDGVPMSSGYGAGFLCHLALDSACHGYVDARAAQGTVSHMAMEGDYDRLLMAGDGLPIQGTAYLPTVSATEVWAAAAEAFEHASPRQMERAYRAMSRYTGMLARAYGKRRGRAVDVVSILPPCRSIRGVGTDSGDPSTGETNAQLDRLLASAVPEAAEQITAFFHAIAQDAPIPDWFDRDFKGLTPRAVPSNVFPSGDSSRCFAPHG